MRNYILILFISFLPILTWAQPSKLAQQYFQNGEYEKAATLYQKLYTDSNQNDYYFNKYTDCLIALEKYEEADKTIKKQIKKTPKSIQLYVAYGKLFEKQGMEAEAAEQYEKAIKKLTADRFVVTKLANAFSTLTKYDFAIRTYEEGAKLMKDKYIFSYNLGDLYRRKGESTLMVENYLNSLKDNPNRLNSLKSLFQRYLNVEEYDELQAQLYERIQDQPEDVEYTELLTWVFIQRKDYKGALRQTKAMDKRLDENGGRVFHLAEVAANDKDYDTAISAYEYIINDKGPTSGFYIDAKRESLGCERRKLVEGYSYEETDLRQLESQYEEFLSEFGKNKTTATIIAELANLEAFYLNDLDKAISLLNELIAYPGINKYTLAEAKLSLADFYLMKDEIWESTLLYSQVDKTFKDDILGHEARYRNAKLSYYAGDFQWAQTQFDVLKASTSKLIANDALDLSIFIMDNIGLDTTEAPLKLYSDADLLVFQNRFDQAFLKLDTLNRTYPKHSLEDDILFTKATIYNRQRNFEKAAELYEQIGTDYADEIRADNSLFELAKLYENQLNNPEKAKEVYEKIFIEFSGSTFAVEARKRFRQLRGDDIQ